MTVLKPRILEKPSHYQKSNQESGPFGFSERLMALKSGTKSLSQYHLGELRRSS